MLNCNGKVFPGIVHVSGFQQRNQFHGFGPYVFLGPVSDQLIIEPGHLIVFFRKLEYHKTPVTAGVQIGIRMPPYNPFSSQNFVPVIGINLVCKTTIVRITKDQLVGCKTNVPFRIFGNQGLVYNLEISRTHYIGRLVKL